MSEPGLHDPQGAGPEEHRETSHFVSPGAQLAAWREERGWTVEQVASQLNLAPRQIAALESDDYPALPGMPIVRGFIRAYAKLLKVDAAPLLGAVGGDTVLMHGSLAPMATLATPFSETRLPSMTDRPGLSSKWVVGVLLVVLVVVAVWAARRGGELPALSHGTTTAHVVTAPVATPQIPQQPASSPTASVAEQTVPAASAPTAVGMPQNPATDASANSGSSVSQPGQEPGAPASATSPSSASQPGAAASATPTPAGAPVSAVHPAASKDAAAAAGNDALVLNAHADTWVEVKRASDNKVLLSRVLKAGETERVDVAAPVSVVIGNVSGVDASLRGTRVDFGKVAASNVARLTLK